MEQLNDRIEELKASLPTDVKHLVENDNLKKNSKYPFNQYTNIFSVLFWKGNLSLDDYFKIRDDYFTRNPYLDLFEKAPRTFGQTWGEEWLKSKTASLQDPPKMDGYTSQFDLWFPLSEDSGIKVEVKSSHVAYKDSDRILVEKALKKPRGTDEEVKQSIEELSFEMNFQQLKPSCCDVFVWIAVWLDDIDIWVIPSSRIVMRTKGSPRRKPKDSIVTDEGIIYMGTQHQGGKGGTVPEGQVFVTNKHYKDLDCYKVTLESLIDKIKEYGNVNQRT